MSALLEEVLRLKTETGALVLAHNYQVPEVYDAADFIGDSLELARQAQGTDARFIVFCGVRFMAETAKLLNPVARVVLAESRAGCQMADMISAEALRLRREELGPVRVVAYVNTPVEVKAESDICCTSANVVKVVQSLGTGPLLLVPDRNLAAYAARVTGREIVPWEGFCYVHATFTAADVARARAEHPGALVIAHPECRPEVIDAADRVASTSGMAQLAGEHAEVVLATEAGMCERVRRLHPQCRCFPLRRSALCRNMKLTQLESVRAALEGGGEEMFIGADVAGRARHAIERMTALG